MFKNNKRKFEEISSNNEGQYIESRIKKVSTELDMLQKLQKKCGDVDDISSSEKFKNLVNNLAKFCEENPSKIIFSSYNVKYDALNKINNAIEKIAVKQYAPPPSPSPSPSLFGNTSVIPTKVRRSVHFKK